MLLHSYTNKWMRWTRHWKFSLLTVLGWCPTMTTYYSLCIARKTQGKSNGRKFSPLPSETVPFPFRLTKRPFNSQNKLFRTKIIGSYRSICANYLGFMAFLKHVKTKVWICCFFVVNHASLTRCPIVGPCWTRRRHHQQPLKYTQSHLRVQHITQGSSLLHLSKKHSAERNLRPSWM